jgi:hypothetical protein
VSAEAILKEALSYTMAISLAVAASAAADSPRAPLVSVPGYSEKLTSAKGSASPLREVKIKKESSSSARDLTKDFHAPIADPDNREGFFQRNSAQTTFAPAVAARVKPNLEYFPALQKFEVEKEPAELVSESASSEKSEPDLTSADSIVAAFGKPDEDDKLLAEEKAPPSYKGMMAALEIGDEKLAWKYARRYARRIRELSSRSSTIMGLTGKAFEREGVLAKDGWQSSPQFARQQELLEEDLEESGLLKAEETRVAALDPATRAFLKKAEDVEEMEGGASKAPTDSAVANSIQPSTSAAASKQASKNAAAPLSEEQMRVALRQKFAGKVPVDPKGAIGVIFFFRPNDSRSIDMAPQVEQFFRKAAVLGGVSFTAMTLEAPNPVEVDAFRRKTGATFAIQSGATFAKKFDLKVTPTMLFLTQTDGKVVVETGPRPELYLTELLSAMRGTVQ